MYVKIILLITIINIVGCAANSVNDLRSNSKIHEIYYYDGNLEDIYNQSIKKYNECGIPVSNSFIDTNLGEAGISYTAVGHGWYAHEDFKKEKGNKVRIDVYSIMGSGIPGNFLKISKHAVDSKQGCPQNLF